MRIHYSPETEGSSGGTDPEDCTTCEWWDGEWHPIGACPPDTECITPDGPGRYNGETVGCGCAPPPIT
jgi:hypothetical protein